MENRKVRSIDTCKCINLNESKKRVPPAWLPNHTTCLIIDICPGCNQHRYPHPPYSAMRHFWLWRALHDSLVFNNKDRKIYLLADRRLLNTVWTNLVFLVGTLRTFKKRWHAMIDLIESVSFPLASRASVTSVPSVFTHSHRLIGSNPISMWVCIFA